MVFIDPAEAQQSSAGDGSRGAGESGIGLFVRQ